MRVKLDSQNSTIRFIHEGEYPVFGSDDHTIFFAHGLTPRLLSVINIQNMNVKNLGEYSLKFWISDDQFITEHEESQVGILSKVNSITGQIKPLVVPELKGKKVRFLSLNPSRNKILLALSRYWINGLGIINLDGSGFIQVPYMPYQSPENPKIGRYENGMEGYDRIENAVWSPDGQKVAVAVSEHIHIIDLNAKKVIKTISLGKTSISATCWISTKQGDLMVIPGSLMGVEDAKNITIYNMTTNTFEDIFSSHRFGYFGCH